MGGWFSQNTTIKSEGGVYEHHLITMRLYGVGVPIKRQPQMSTVVVYIYENVVNKEDCGVRATSAKRKHSEIEGALGGVDFKLHRRLRVGEYEGV